MGKINFSFENITLFLIGLSFFIGIWHAFPMLNVVNDEMYYVGGVFRALEHHTIVPMANDVPYGTLTYLSNYVLILITLPIYLFFNSFSISATKLFLIQRPEFAYFTLRFLSALFSLVLLYFVNKLIKKEINDTNSRLFLLILLFTNLITGVILHTGKMWVLSMLLVVVSFYCLIEAVRIKNDNNSSLDKNIFLSILFSFLALSNLPLNFYSLINIPILLYLFKGDRKIFYKIIKYTIIGGFIYIALTLFNLEGIKNQIMSIFTEYHPLNIETQKNLNFFQSLFVYIKKTVALFIPTIIVLFLSIKDGIKNKRLFYISLLYFSLYLILITFVANWAQDIKESLRYLFPLSFFLIFIVISFNFKITKAHYLIGVFSIVSYCTLLYLLSAPTTYNNAYKWVNQNLTNKSVIIVNTVPELQLKKNKESSILIKQDFCSSKCKNIIAFDLNNDFKPVIYDGSTMDYKGNAKEVYYIYEKPLFLNNLFFVNSFVNNSNYYHSVDYNLGNYFDMSFWRIKNLGKNIYIYINN